MSMYAGGLGLQTTVLYRSKTLPALNMPAPAACVVDGDHATSQGADTGLAVTPGEDETTTDEWVWNGQPKSSLCNGVADKKSPVYCKYTLFFLT